jgi:hypothetical protein
MTRRLLDLAGIGRERLHLAWVSSAEAQRFADVASEVIEAVKNQGPLDRTAMGAALDACEMTVNTETVRWLVGKEVKITAKGDVYGRRWTVDKYEGILNTLLEREFHKNLIYLAVKGGCASVRDVSEKTGLDVKRVSYLLADLEKTKRVEFRAMQERKPVFAAL